jgi:endonuclease/exonuclease/phosphatase family metal-dependent hydrolase
VVNVHLTQRRSQSDIRRQQLQETLEWMNRRQAEAPADVIILGGDFNCTAGAQEFALVRDVEVCGNLRFADYNSAAPTSGTMGDPYERIDYILIAAPERTVGSIGEAVLWHDGIPTIDGSSAFWPSDHLPLLQVFSISQGE